MIERVTPLFSPQDGGGGGGGKPDKVDIAGMGLGERARHYESAMPDLLAKIRERMGAGDLGVTPGQVHESAQKGKRFGTGNYNADLSNKNP